MHVTAIVPVCLCSIKNSHQPEGEHAHDYRHDHDNIAFLILGALLAWRFLCIGGRQMIAMMGRPLTSDTQQGGAPAGDGAALRPTATIVTV